MAEMKKYNQNHDEKTGQFSSGGGSGGDSGRGGGKSVSVNGFTITHPGSSKGVNITTRDVRQMTSNIIASLKAQNLPVNAETIRDSFRLELGTKVKVRKDAFGKTLLR